MLYQYREGKIVTGGLEYSVSYHCNLRCSSCSHMSPFASRKFPDLDSFEADLRYLGGCLHAGDLRLVGGEPLLNPRVTEFARAAKQSGIADTVMLTTNGLLLHRMPREFWESVDFLSITLYPGNSPSAANLARFRELAAATNTRLRIFENPVFRTTTVTRPHPDDWVTGMIFNTCKGAHLYHCHMIHEGYLYKCAVPPFLPDFLAKLGSNVRYDPREDGLPIGPETGVEACRKFLHGKRRLTACRYCLGYVGKFQMQHQLGKEELHRPAAMNIARSSHMDRFKFVKEVARYGYRRGKEALLGSPQW